MGFNTFPCNPYPISTEELNKGNNDDLNTRVSTLEGEVSDLNSTKANQIIIAPFFSAEASYSVGDLVYYNGLTYRCTNDHEGEWDADDFAATTIASELDTLKSGFTNLDNNKTPYLSLSLSGGYAELESQLNANFADIPAGISTGRIGNQTDIYSAVSIKYSSTHATISMWDVNTGKNIIWHKDPQGHSITNVSDNLIGKHGVYEYNLLVTLAEFDGVSSYGAYLTSAYNALQSYINNLPDGVLIHIDRMNVGDIAINNPSSRIGDKSNTVGGLLFAQFIAFDIANGHVVVRKVDAIGKTYEMVDDGVYSDLTSNVPAAGGTISVNVTTYYPMS